MQRDRGHTGRRREGREVLRNPILQALTADSAGHG